MSATKKKKVEKKIGFSLNREVLAVGNARGRSGEKLKGKGGSLNLRFGESPGGSEERSVNKKTEET